MIRDWHRSALAYAALRQDGAAWLASWFTDDPDAADELNEWELEGHPWSSWPPFTTPWRQTMTTTTTTVADVLAALEAARPTDLCAAVEAIVGDPDEADYHHRMNLTAATFDALGIEPEAAAGFTKAEAALAVVRAAQEQL